MLSVHRASFILLCGVAAAHAAGQVSVVAVTGESAPGTGALYASVGDVRINAAGDMAFRARLTGMGVTRANEIVLCRLPTGGDLELVARLADAAPGTAGVLSSITSIALDEAGQITFVATIDEPGPRLQNNTAIYTVNADNSLTLVHRDPTTLIGGGVRDTLRIGPSGAPTASLSGGLLEDGVPTLAAGQPVPNAAAFGIPANATLRSFDTPSINAAGDLTCRIWINWNGTPTESRSAVMVRRGGEISYAAVEGGVIPGTSRSWTAFGAEPVVLDDGSVIFYGTDNAMPPAGAIYRAGTGAPASITRLAGVGDEPGIPGAAVTRIASTFDVGADGSVLVTANVANATGTTALLRVGNGIEPVLLTNDVIPATGDSVKLLGPAWFAPDGALAVKAQLQGALAFSTDTLLFARPGYQLAPALAQGDAIYIGGVADTVRLVRFDDGGIENGNGQLASDGRMAVVVELDSRREALLRIDVPAPGCPADWDGSGGVDGDDIGAFFTDWQQGDADIDGSGGTDGDDIGYFFERWQAGC